MIIKRTCVYLLLLKSSMNCAYNSLCIYVTGDILHYVVTKFNVHTIVYVTDDILHNVVTKFNVHSIVYVIGDLLYYVVTKFNVHSPESDDDESEEEESDEFYENTLAKVDEQQLTEL